MVQWWCRGVSIGISVLPRVISRGLDGTSMQSIVAKYVLPWCFRCVLYGDSVKLLWDFHGVIHEASMVLLWKYNGASWCLHGDYMVPLASMGLA